MWPWLGAAIVVILWKCILKSPFPNAPDPDSLFGAAATVASIFASFLGVSQAIILSIKGTESFRILDKLGYGNVLFSYLREGIIASIAFASLSIVGFFVEQEYITHALIFEYFKIAWVFFAVAALLTYVRVTNLLFKLLRHS